MAREDVRMNTQRVNHNGEDEPAGGQRGALQAIPDLNLAACEVPRIIVPHASTGQGNQHQDNNANAPPTKVRNAEEVDVE